MLISQQIEQIITARHNDIEPKFNNLWKKSIPLIDFASHFKAMVDSSEWKLLLNKNPELKKTWDSYTETKDTEQFHISELFIKTVLENIGCFSEEKNDSYLERGYFSALKSRLGKDNIEVCIMGPVSTGKSSLMQGLTGAPIELLPTGTGKTTAARTTFINSDQKKAIIHFYTVNEFSSIFNTYIDNFNKVLEEDKKTLFPKWNPKVKDLNEFCEELKSNVSYDDSNFESKQIPNLETMITATDYFDTFSKFYVDGCPDYGDVLGESPKTLSEDKIMQGKLIPFVSYKNKITDTKPTSFIALGVKEIFAYWPLHASTNNRHENLGNLALVDTMGIGEAKFRVEEDLSEIVRSRADLAIALCKIHNDKDDFEANHVQDKKFLKVLSGLRERQPQQWVYYLANEHADSGITQPLVESFRDAIWETISKGRDKFELNKENWRSLPFMIKADSNPQNNNFTINYEQITNYLTNTVLANLTHDISEIDRYFIGKAESEYKTAKSYLDKILILFSKLSNLTIDISDENKLIEISAQNTLQSLINVTKNVRSEVAKENPSLCSYIIDSVYPLLFEPELYRIFNISLPQENLFLHWEPGLRTNSAVDAGILSKDTQFRETIIYNILSELNYYLVNPTRHSSSFREAKAYMETELKETKALQDVLPYYQELLNNKFFETIYNQTKDVIENTLIPIVRYSSQVTEGHDNEQKAIFENHVGRELEIFYTKREEILKGIWNRLDTSDCDNVNKKLSAYFTNKTNEIVNNFSKAVYETLCNDGTIEKENISDYKNWLVQFVEKSKSNKLIKATKDFIKTQIDLNSIVTKMRANTLLKNMCKVELCYDNPEDAAYSFFACLFRIDRELRLAFWQMYTETFKDYGIYAPALNVFMNTVLCVNSSSTVKTDEYNEFKSLIIEEKKRKFKTSENGKLAKAKKEFDKCVEELQNLK